MVLNFAEESPMIRLETKSGHCANKPTTKVVSLLILYLEDIHGLEICFCYYDNSQFGIFAYDYNRHIMKCT